MVVQIYSIGDVSLIRLDATVVPSLQFHIDADSISVYNNELGFEEQNIRAVCDVGSTTKGKHKFGYIGLSLSLLTTTLTSVADHVQFFRGSFMFYLLWFM